VTLSPHLGYVTRELLGAVYSDTVEAVAAWLNGEPIRIANHQALLALLSQVNRQR
jgi:phosphoglycerate dehydrogenase-like enzyme